MFGMNPLFLGLIAAGVLLVAGVLIYNWLQERRVRRRIDAAFRKPEDTPPGAADDGERIEPILRDEELEPRQSVAVESATEIDDMPLDMEPAEANGARERALAHVVPSTKAERAGIAPDPDIECVALLQPERPVSTAELGAA